MVGWPMRSRSSVKRRHRELGARPGQRLLLHLREVIEHGIAHLAFVRMAARPGAVFRELRPGRPVSIRARLREPRFRRAAVHPDFFHQRARPRRRERAVHAGDERRAAAPGKVHHVDGVAAVDEVVRPAWPAVRRHQHLDAALSTAFADEHDRIGIENLFRHPGFDVHRAAHALDARLAFPFAADVEVTLPADLLGGEGRHRLERRPDRRLCLRGLPGRDRQRRGERHRRERHSRYSGDRSERHDEVLPCMKVRSVLNSSTFSRRLRGGR